MNTKRDKKIREFLLTESDSLLESISAMSHRMDKEGLDVESITLDDLWKAITDKFEVYRTQTIPQ